MKHKQTESSKQKFTFAGHESFQCRHLWLKKGFDFINDGYSFNEPDAVVKLGVGKNMVASIRYWMRAFGLTDVNDKLTRLADKLLGSDGWDPYFEDGATRWLLHYLLVTNGHASLYNLVFNELRKERVEFSKQQAVNFLKRKIEEAGHTPPSEKTLGDDFGVFLRMYLNADGNIKDLEDSFSGLLTELNLVTEMRAGEESQFVIDTLDRPELPFNIVLFAILSRGQNGKSINLKTIENEPNNAGMVFALNRAGLVNKIERMTKKYKDITYNDQAGVRELQFKKTLDPLHILDAYYAR